MKPQWYCLLVLLLAPLPLAAQDIRALLPGEEQRDWNLLDPPRVFVGDSLFDFIDGGAAIYHEYGFRQAIASRYLESDNHTISAEIYEMAEPAAAYGIFSFQRGDGAQPAALGDSGVVGSYYVSFWKDRFVVMVTSYDSSLQAKNQLLSLARLIDRRIAGQSDLPPLMQRLLPGSRQCAQAVYIRGYLGLVNQYDFGAGDPFATREGVVIVCGDVKLVVLQFDSEREASAAHSAARPVLNRTPRFSAFSAAEDTLRCSDREGNHLVFTRYGRYVIVTIAPQADAAESALRRISPFL